MKNIHIGVPFGAQNFGSEPRKSLVEEGVGRKLAVGDPCASVIGGSKARLLTRSPNDAFSYFLAGVLQLALH